MAKAVLGCGLLAFIGAGLTLGWTWEAPVLATAAFALLYFF